MIFILKRFIFLAACTVILSCGSTLETKPDKDSSIATSSKDKTTKHPQTPIMGWASWNNFHVNIDEKTIKEQADAIVSSGMKDAGYQYINIDDGFFGGRDEQGRLLINKKRFPKGMRDISDYIHSKGLKSGIYAEAGINTCASYWDKDSLGIGSGLYGHDKKDLNLMLNEWNNDFIKIDWCGADALELDEQTRYTEFGNLIQKLKPETVYNICSRKFPGKWAVQIADSWRISGDITNTFESILEIIDLNANLWRYASPGHVNDMDMLQVGRGMSLHEDRAHFTMWCMMASPLLAGNDLRTMSDETLEILTNKEIIAINQDPLVYQARRFVDLGDIEVWAKPLISTMSGEVAVTLLNRSDEEKEITFDLSSVGIDFSKGYELRDLWNKKNYKESIEMTRRFSVPKHGVVVLKIKGTALSHNVFQKAKANYYDF